MRANHAVKTPGGCNQIVCRVRFNRGTSPPPPFVLRGSGLVVMDAQSVTRVSVGEERNLPTVRTADEWRMGSINTSNNQKMIAGRRIDYGLICAGNVIGPPCEKRVSAAKSDLCAQEPVSIPSGSDRSVLLTRKMKWSQRRAGSETGHVSARPKRSCLPGGGPRRKQEK